MSKLAALDTIAGDVTTMQLAQATFSKQLDSCLEAIESHEELISASSIQTCLADIQSLKSDHAVLTTEFTDLEVMVDSLNIPDLQSTQPSIKADIASWKTKKMALSDDKTPHQARQFQELRDELKARRSSGDTDLTIRYIRGLPTTVNPTVIPPKN
ncbi:hypothetical protein HHI36_002015 [Cryptolaemus montrouzieri]|uniref:Uncharacterized protein n=1 Tax=Cryptolaemus montrouzieri TaxID=559131 RepID=A0ABD2PA15_9CUCU